MKLSKTVFSILVLGFFHYTDATEIEVGDQQISVPTPDGFVELTPQMTPYYETMRAYISPDNIRYFTLVDENEGAAILRGEAVELGRFMSIESQKVMREVSVSYEQFAELRGIVRDQIDEVFASVETQLPELIEKGNKDVSETFSTDLAVELGGMVPLPVHLERDNLVANSMYLTAGASVDGEDYEEETSAATIVFLHVQNKILFLYVYGSKSDLGWTRDTAAAWADSILAANPSTEDDESSVEQPDSSGIDWSKVLERALFGVILGGGVVLLVSLMRRRKTD